MTFSFFPAEAMCWIAEAVVVGHEKLRGIFTEQGDTPESVLSAGMPAAFFHGRGTGAVGFLRFLCCSRTFRAEKAIHFPPVP